ERRVAERHQLVLEIPGQGVNRSDLALARSRGVAWRRGPTRVCGLGPRVPGVKGKVVPGDTDPGGPVQARALVDGDCRGTRLFVDEVVGARGEDVGMVGVHGHGRLVLMVLRG